MQNDECRMQNEERANQNVISAFCILHSAFIILHFFSVSNMKMAEFTGGGEGGDVDVADVAGHAVFDRRQQLVHFFLGSFNDQFDPAIGQIADITADIVPHGDVLDRVAKTDALHASTVI